MKLRWAETSEGQSQRTIKRQTGHLKAFIQQIKRYLHLGSCSSIDDSDNTSWLLSGLYLAVSWSISISENWLNQLSIPADTFSSTCVEVPDECPSSVYALPFSTSLSVSEHPDWSEEDLSTAACVSSVDFVSTACATFADMISLEASPLASAVGLRCPLRFFYFEVRYDRLDQAALVRPVSPLSVLVSLFLSLVLISKTSYVVCEADVDIYCFVFQYHQESLWSNVSYYL